MSEYSGASLCLSFELPITELIHKMEPSSQEDSSESNVTMIEQQLVSCNISDSESYSEDATAFSLTCWMEISLSLSLNYVKD
jgi:hypothetical protein